MTRLKKLPHLNGIRWYRTTSEDAEEKKKATWGFASNSSSVNLYWVDVATDGKDAQRLSLHINDNGSFQGGHRCGAQKATYNDLGKDSTTFDADDAWELVFYHAN